MVKVSGLDGRMAPCREGRSRTDMNKWPPSILVMSGLSLTFAGPDFSKNNGFLPPKKAA